MTDEEISRFSKRFKDHPNKKEFVKSKLKGYKARPTHSKCDTKIEIDYDAVYKLMYDMFENDLGMFLGDSPTCNNSYCYEYITKKQIYQKNESIKNWAYEIAACFVELYIEVYNEFGINGRILYF